MWNEYKAASPGHQNAKSYEKWIVPALSVWMVISCAVFYLFLAQTTENVKMYLSNVQEDIDTVKSLQSQLLTFMAQLIQRQERYIERQSFLVQDIMSQAEVVFTDLEVVSQRNQRRLIQLMRTIESVQKLAIYKQLSHSKEVARRKVEDTIRELWYFIYDQLHVLEKMLKPESHNDLNINHSLAVTVKPTYDTNLFSEFNVNFSLNTLSLMGETKSYTERHLLSIERTLPSFEDSTSTVKYETFTDDSFNGIPNASLSPKLNLLNEINEETAGVATLQSTVASPTVIPCHRNTSYKRLLKFKEALLGYRRTLVDNLDRLGEADNAEDHRQTMSSELGKLVQKRLHFLQNPANCRSTRKVSCDTKMCGFGCNFHHFVYCLITAYATHRPLVLSVSGSWKRLFMPLSQTCQDQCIEMGDSKCDDKENTGQDPNQGYESAQEEVNLTDEEEVPDAGTERLPIIDNLSSKNEYLPLSVPQDLAQRLETFHGYPAVWWIGQIAAYIFRPTEAFKTYIQSVRDRLGFQKPVVGVHVRRTDKLDYEAAFHSLEEYMVHVDDYFDQRQRSLPELTRRVYLASDDASVIQEAIQKYPKYTFINNINESHIIVSERNTFLAMRGIATDIYFLSRSDFLVCTFSSQVCRLAYELMQTLHGDASNKFRSLDDVYYYGGQIRHDVTARESHSADKYWEDTIDLNKGDKVQVAGNHWNGFSKGLNLATLKAGLYPSYKVDNQIMTFPMPEYPEVV